MASAPKIKDHAKKLESNPFYRHQYECLHCHKRFEVYYEDFKNLRAHMRRMHRLEYMGPYIIEEEQEFTLA